MLRAGQHYDTLWRHRIRILLENRIMLQILKIVIHIVKHLEFDICKVFLLVLRKRNHTNMVPTVFAVPAGVLKEVIWPMSIFPTEKPSVKTF